MQDRHTLATLIGGLAFAIALQLVPATVGVPVSWLRVLAWVAFASLVAWTIFDLWAWRWKPILRSWVERPDLHGTWRATIRSNWTDPTTGKTLDAIEAYMVVRQTWRSIRLQLMTAESTSEVLEAGILQAGANHFRVAAIYRSNSRKGAGGEGGHIGMLFLDVPGRRPKALSGHYTTDRKTEGEIELQARTRRLMDSFRHASDTFARMQGKSPAPKLADPSPLARAA